MKYLYLVFLRIATYVSKILIWKKLRNITVNARPFPFPSLPSSLHSPLLIYMPHRTNHQDLPLPLFSQWSNPYTPSPWHVASASGFSAAPRKSRVFTQLCEKPAPQSSNPMFSSPSPPTVEVSRGNYPCDLWIPWWPWPYTSGISRNWGKRGWCARERGDLFGGERSRNGVMRGGMYLPFR